MKLYTKSGRPVKGIENALHHFGLFSVTAILVAIANGRISRLQLSKINGIGKKSLDWFFPPENRLMKDDPTFVISIHDGFVEYSYDFTGRRKDQPNVPNEDNPYVPGTPAHKAWTDGATTAMLECQED